MSTDHRSGTGPTVLGDGEIDQVLVNDPVHASITHLVTGVAVTIATILLTTGQGPQATAPAQQGNLVDQIEQMQQQPGNEENEQ